MLEKSEGWLVLLHEICTGPLKNDMSMTDSVLSEEVFSRRSQHID